MKSKSIIKALFWTLLIAVIFQFSLMIPTSLVERTAKEKAVAYAQAVPLAQQPLAKEVYEKFYLDSIATEVIFQIPYLAQFTYNELKGQQLQLGLDLQGGMQLTLQLNTADFLKDLVGESSTDNFYKAIAATDNLNLAQKEYITAFFDHFQQLEEAEYIIRLFSKHPQINIPASASLQDLETAINQLLVTVAEDTQFLMEQRINGHGLAQTKISRDVANNYIHVEVPEAQNPERIRSLLVSAAELAFWDTYRITDRGVLDAFYAADNQLQEDKFKK